jgi:hypothetical protein
MVLEVLADTRKIDKCLDTSSMEELLGTNITELKKLRGMYRTSSHQNLLIRLDVKKTIFAIELNTSGNTLLHKNASDG